MTVRTAPPATTARTGPRIAPEALVAVLPVSVLVVVGVLAVTGGVAAPLIGDPGALVRWGQPVVRVLHDVAAALSVGSLVLAACVLPGRGAAFQTALRVALPAVVTWSVAALVGIVVSSAQFFGTPLATPGFGGLLGRWLTEVEAGQQALVTVVLVAVAATVVAAVRTPVGAGVAALVAIAALVPIALGGHSGAAASHDLAVSSLWMHLVGVSVWFGGLLALALVSGGLARDLPDVVARFSTLAGWSFALVAASGVVNAYTRIGTPSALLTEYGVLATGKALALVLLGAAGWWHRRHVVTALALAGGAAGRRPFWRLVAAELLLMGAASGLAVALARTATPVPETGAATPTPAQVVTGEALPPPLSAARWFTEVAPDPLWVAVAVAGVLTYVVGVRRLRRRGDRWPLHRTVLWVLGLALLVYVTCGGPAAYGRVLFSAHMVQHMTLAMVVPPLLVFGAPVTLAVRALPRRRDSSRGPREWLLGLVESRPAKVAANPVVAAVVFAGSLYVFYFTPLFGYALRTHVGHELMTVHFLVSGYLFAQGLVGVDPGPDRPAYPLRLLLLFGTMVFHAFLGVSLTSGETLLQATWFSQLGWPIDLLADQQRGGGIAWGIGELPTIVLAMVVAVQWSRSNSRESRRSDRAADRDGESELGRYNAMLARLSGPGERDR